MNSADKNARALELTAMFVFASSSLSRIERRGAIYRVNIICDTNHTSLIFFLVRARGKKCVVERVYRCGTRSFLLTTTR